MVRRFKMPIIKIEVDEFYKEFYEQGHLDYVLANLNRFDTTEEWKEWLQTEPIAYFNNTDDWEFIDGKILYSYGSEDEESYSPGLIIFLDTEILFHSPEGSQSMFYRLDPNGTDLEAIYVD